MSNLKKHENNCLTWNAFHQLDLSQIIGSEESLMISIIILCIVIYLASYFCLKSSGQSMDVKSMKDFDDYFI